jgi:hypothetical protein
MTLEGIILVQVAVKNTTAREAYEHRFIPHSSGG